jgi:hypothetical protein
MEGTTSAADTLIESIKLTVDETAERVNTTADLLNQVRRSPWIMLGGAILLGYILGSLAREASSAPGRMPDRSCSPNASVHDGHVLSGTHEQASANSTAVMPCSTYGQMIPQADMTHHQEYYERITPGMRGTDPFDGIRRRSRPGGSGVASF